MNDNRKNIKVSERWCEKHNPRRKDANLTWEEYLSGNAPPLERVELVDADELDANEVTLEATEYEKIGRAVAEQLR